MDMMSIAVAKTMVNSTVEEIKEQFGAPLVANAASGMTDQDRVYVYTGNETGFSSGHWYYYNGSNWADGGVYNAVAIETDDTLSVSGKAADGKAVGDQLTSVKSDLSDLDKTIYGKEAIEYTYTSGSYIRTNNSIVSSNGFGYSAPIAVSTGDKVIFTARGYNTTVAMISTCDSEGGSIMCVVPCVDSEVHDYEYTVLEDGYIVVSFAIEYQRDLVIFKANNLANSVASIETVTNGLETKITPEYTETTGKYIHVNSYIASSSGLAYTSPIPVKNKDRVIVNATGYLDRVAMIATCDASGGNITSVVPSQDGVTEYSYTANADGYIMVSYGIRYPHTIVIERLAVNELAGEIETLETKPFISLSLFEHFGVIGDSYASGELYWDSTHEDRYEISWGQILARKLGTVCTNYSRGGFTTRSYLTDNTKGLGYVLSSDPENIYYLALGINDYYNLGESYLGSLTDITDHTSYADYPDTFYGNYGKIIEQVIAHAPHAKLIMFTTANSNTVPALFNEAIINIANHYGLPYIVQLDDPFFTSPLYTKMVSGHPRAVAYSGMAMAFERLITDAILNNWEYFSDYYAYQTM